MGAISFINKYFFGIGIPFLLMGAGIFYCIRLKFFHFLHPIKVLRSFKSERSGGVSSLKAMMLALAGTLGVGNMVGVASAIALGGFGIHYNILNEKTLSEAKKRPEDYPTLQVRLCGWNALFTSLTEKEQDEFIARAMAKNG